MSEVSADDLADILAATRSFVREQVIPREQEIADADAIPDDLREAIKDMGLFGFAIPQEWGGLGLDLEQDVALAQELGYTSLAVRSMFGTNTYPVTYQVLDLLGGTFSPFFLIIITFYAGELIWRERDARMAQIEDALPVRDWV